MNQFAYTIFYVKDVVKAIAFYEAAFGFKRRFIAENNDYGELNTGATVLSFASIELAKTNLPEGFQESNRAQKPFPLEIGITTANVQETLDEAVKAGATMIEKPKTKPWGQTVAYVRDPEGFLVEICSPM